MRVANAVQCDAAVAESSATVCVAEESAGGAGRDDGRAGAATRTAVPRVAASAVPAGCAGVGNASEEAVGAEGRAEEGATVCARHASAETVASTRR